MSWLSRRLAHQAYDKRAEEHHKADIARDTAVRAILLWQRSQKKRYIAPSHRSFVRQTIGISLRSAQWRDPIFHVNRDIPQISV